MAKVRTHIEIDDDPVQAIMDRDGVRTKTAAIDSRCAIWVGSP
jgi:Arc/MetJ family transcription regulator